MDNIDRRILHELQRDGRITNAELAERVSLTATPCLRRLRHLERTGVIRAYRAHLDGNYLGFGFESFVTIRMKTDETEIMSELEARLTSLPEVLEAQRLFGEPDYLLRVALADISAYEGFYRNVLASLPGVGKVTSHLVMKVVKEYEGYDLADE